MKENRRYLFDFLVFFTFLTDLAFAFFLVPQCPQLIGKPPFTPYCITFSRFA